MNQQVRRRIGERSRQHNALKHGVYSMVAILPGEDPQQFELLHSILIKEWKPAGATENDAVLSLAKCMWYKARLQNFLRGKIIECKHNVHHPAFDLVWGLHGLAGLLAGC